MSPVCELFEMSSRDLSLAWALLGQLGHQRDDRIGPVTLGRELLLLAHELVDQENGMTNASMLLNASVATFLWGVIDPLPSEYPIDGPEFGRLDALMWFGITTAIFVPVDAVFDSDDLPERPASMRSIPDPLSLDTASSGFETVGDLTKAGRCSEELAEIIKAEHSVQAAGLHFARAVEMFERGSENQRAKLARDRAVATTTPSSPFFHRQPGSLASTTISGSREYANLRSKLRLR